MSKSRSGFQSKQSLNAVLAALLVLVFILYSRQDSRILPTQTSAASILQNEQHQQQDKAPGDKAVANTASNGKAPNEVESLMNEVELDLFSTSVMPVPAASPTPLLPLANSGSKGTKPGNYGGGIGAGPGTGSSSSSSSSNNNNNNAASPDAPAADRPQAVVIESDIVPNLIPLMLHFATVLGPAWGMILFTIQDHWVEPLSPAFARFRADGRIQVRFLPAGTDLTSSAAVSQFLTAPWIWEQLQAARRILLFQSDSILCSKSEARVEDYFEYDLVGAPIAAVWGEGYNGGLSIRNPRAFLDVIRETDFETSGQKFEDQFFYNELLRRGANMPTEEVAKTFSVETIFYETPLGYHQPQRWQAPNMAAIEEWCPEVKMLIGRRAE